MTLPVDIHRLSRFRNPLFHAATTDRPSANLCARPVFAGPDAAIEVEGDCVRGFINGEASGARGQLAQLIDGNRDRIMAAAAAYWRDGVSKIVFSGTWHHIDWGDAPRFEGCLVHVVGMDGLVTSRLQGEPVFEWESTRHRAGYGFTTSVYGALDEITADLDGLADYEICLTRGRYKGASGLGMVGGMIWVSHDDAEVPVLYSAAACVAEVTFELDEEEEEYLSGQPVLGDGGLAAAIDIKLERLKTEPGWFRGKGVDRFSYRPRRLKLVEVPRAVDAIGFWIQFRTAGKVSSSEFRFFGSKTAWAGKILERRDGVEGDDVFGNRYASDWIFEPAAGHPDREIRLLALGPIPEMTHVPP